MKKTRPILTHAKGLLSTALLWPACAFAKPTGSDYPWDKFFNNISKELVTIHSFQ